MLVLIKKATLLLPFHPLDGKVRDILIEDGSIKKIATQISIKQKHTLINADQLFVSMGWVDTFCDFNDPGHEYKEDIESGLSAARQGGYTDVFITPNTSPPIDNKSQIAYLQQKNATHLTRIQPIAAASKATEGIALAEIYDMQSAGATAFGDGHKTINSSALLLQLLKYVKTFNGVVVQSTNEASLSNMGLMHEGNYSTQLGVAGIPAIAEEIQIQRDLSLLKYTGSKMHITGVSTLAGIKLIKAAKKEGLKVSCSVALHNLLFNDSNLETYNSLYKVEPPLRTASDQRALIQAVKDGVIDCIASYHQPQDWDAKNCEFEYAKKGMATLETVLQSLLDIGTPDEWIKSITYNARKIFNLEQPIFAENEEACLTIFSTADTCNYEAIKQTKGINSPYIGKELVGKILGVINQGKTKLF